MPHAISAVLANTALLSPEFHTILADPPWRFINRTGKTSPEHRRLHRYPTMALTDIHALPVSSLSGTPCHLYLWVPNALLADGLSTLAAWGFTYKTQLIWLKILRDGQPDIRGCGFYFRGVTESILFGTKGQLRPRSAGRRTANLLSAQKREHSRKPNELYTLIESCSHSPYLELFARFPRTGWTQWPPLEPPDSTAITAAQPAHSFS